VQQGFDMIETVQLGRDAAARHDWAEAIDQLAAVDRQSGLSAEDLELLGTSAWWAGRPDDSTEALERAFAAYAEANQPLASAWVAMTLAYQAFRRQLLPVGGGWLARAEHLLESEPESSMHARLAVFHALGALMAGQLDVGMSLTERAAELAQRHGDESASAIAKSFKGMALVFAGDLANGLALVDEAAAAAATGQLDLRIASDIWCNTIAATRTAGDYQRAAQWADEGERWMRRQKAGGYPGVCQVHRAELKRLRGQWSEAEQEARRACEVLQEFGLVDGLGYAHNEIGEVRLRMGDLDGAAEAFDRAYEFGHDAQPGLSLLHLARGEVDDAARSIARALAATGGDGGAADRATRAKLLPAQIEIALAAGDLETAGPAVDELEAIAADFHRPVFEAGALTCRGGLLLGEDRPSEASPLLGRSWRLWLQNDLPYESALARLRYGQALLAEGDLESARRDLRAARNTFERLGAMADVRRVDALLGGDIGASTLAAEPKVTRTFMFTDIVTSTNLVGLIGDDAWSELLRWHDRELRSSFANHRGAEANHTGDGFFVAFEKAADALECAVDIQRRLARHRREHGFAPTVRIGIHTAEATKEGGNYHGHGVHVAARVASEASGEEILVSQATLDAVPSVRFAVSEGRLATLKGVTEPVSVRSVNWK
jgi:class 3 adenylate cyclase